VIDAITSGDLARLEHIGLFSVQLQPPGETGPSDPAEEAGRSVAALLRSYLERKPDAA
jgi:hypothetical protein